jgi:3-dehydroquinate synthetase
MRADPITVRVRHGASEYPVAIGSGLADQLPDLLTRHAPAHRYVIISDDNVGPIHGSAAMASLRRAGRDVELLEFPAGEAHKTREEWGRLTDRMLDSVSVGIPSCSQSGAG